MSRNFGWFRLGVPVVVGILAAALGLSTRAASAGPKPVTPCISPTEVNLNDRWGVSDAIIAPFCPNLAAGRRWAVSNAWFMGPAFDAMPPGFVPDGATPVEDFIAKFVGVKYVVDPGTKQEKTYVFPSDETLGVLNAPPFDVVLGSLKPASVGDHVVGSYLLLSAMHCDGIGAVAEENCLPAGETLYQTIEFTVTPGHN